MSAILIRSALEVALAAISPALSTQYENTAFSPVPGTAYQRVYVLWNEPLNPEIGTFTQERGILQISLAYPLDTGPTAAATRAELIRSTFVRGTSFTSGGVTVTIERTPEIAPAQIEPDRYVVPVRVRFFANRP